MASLTFYSKQETINIKTDKALGLWLVAMLEMMTPAHVKTWTYKEVSEHYEQAGHEDFELFWDNKPVNGLYKFGLLTL
jgi:hypothetical protein